GLLRGARPARMGRGHALRDARGSGGSCRRARHVDHGGDPDGGWTRPDGSAPGSRGCSWRRAERARSARRSGARRVGLLRMARAPGAAAGALRGPRAPAGGHTRTPASRGSRARRAHGARAEGGAGVFRGRGRAPDRGEDRLVEEKTPTPPVEPAASAWTGSGLVVVEWG